MVIILEWNTVHEMFCCDVIGFLQFHRIHEKETQFEMVIKAYSNPKISQELWWEVKCCLKGTTQSEESGCAVDDW